MNEIKKKLEKLNFSTQIEKEEEQLPPATSFQQAFIFIALMIPALFVLYLILVSKSGFIFFSGKDGGIAFSSTVLFSYIIFYVFYFHVLKRPLVSIINNPVRCVRYVAGYLLCYCITYIIAGLLDPLHLLYKNPSTFIVMLFISVLFGMKFSSVYAALIYLIHQLIVAPRKAFYRIFAKTFIPIVIFIVYLLAMAHIFLKFVK